MARFGGRHLGDGFYEEPEWWPEYLRIEREESDHGEGSVDARELWAHIFENWRRAVLPDLQRFYPRLPAENEHELLALPWRSLREVILSLFGIRDSLTGSTFTRFRQTPEEDS